MLKAMTGFTLPDNTRYEASAELDDDAIEPSIMHRLIGKGVLVFIPDEDVPVPEAVEDADALPDPDPTPTTKKRSKAVSGPQDAGEQS